MELAIDTSTDLASIALSNGGEAASVLTWNTRQNHSTELMPNIDYVLGRGYVDSASLEVIFVATGPGSFNKTHQFSFYIDTSGFAVKEHDDGKNQPIEHKKSRRKHLFHKSHPGPPHQGFNNPGYQQLTNNQKDRNPEYS